METGSRRVYTISLVSEEVSVQVPEGTLLHEALSLLLVRTSRDYSYAATCGGKGTCGKCRVRVITGSCPSPTEQERSILGQEALHSGYRLACMVPVSDDLIIEFDQHTQEASILTELYTDRAYQYDQVITHSGVEPSIHQFGYLHALCSEAARMGVPLDGVQLLQLPGLSACVARRRVALYHLGKWPVAVGPVGEPGYLAAVDVGTTTVACHLIDQQDGTLLASASCLNSQRVLGADVISRIAAIQQDDRQLGSMQKMILDDLDRLLREVTTSCGAAPSQVILLVISGNTTMSHLVLGIDPISLSHVPFTPVFTERVLTRLSIGERTLSTLLLPGVSAYIGSDVLSGCVVCDLDTTEQTTLLVDIGTNGEMVLAHEGRFFAASTAAGPAFEGASILCGSGGVTGAIDSFWIEEQKLSYHVIGDEPARSICGSGILDLVALLVTHGLIDSSGRLIDPPSDSSGPFTLERDQRGRKLVIIDRERQITFSQKDVRQVQMAKAAIAVGLEYLLHAAGCSFSDLKRLYLAGGFGSYMRIESAVSIGMIPESWASKTVGVGNTSITGAVGAVSDNRFLERMESLKQRVELVELAREEAFASTYMGYMSFISIEDDRTGQSMSL